MGILSGTLLTCMRFLEHETIEAGLMKQGAGAREAHLQTHEKQGIAYEPGYETQRYHPNVIGRCKEYFNLAAWPKWRAFKTGSKIA